MQFKERSYKKELLDDDNIPFADIQQNMKELDFINKWLGGHTITVKAFAQLAGNKKDISVCEIGCGGGDNLVAIDNFCKKKQIKVRLTGIDLKEECIEFAKSRNLITHADWITSDYSRVVFDTKPDILFSSLFCHHFTNEQLLFQLQWMKQNVSVGFFINDLHRHIVAYYAIKTLTQLFSTSYLVKNDAPLSVARGFTKKELQTLCEEAGIENAAIYWKWAFRYLVLYPAPRS